MFDKTISAMKNRFAPGGKTKEKNRKEQFTPVESRMKFSDVAGNDEAKAAVADVVDFIRDPGKYERYGARMPKGVLLYGPPGTGKTLMAKAVAGESGAAFFSVCGSDFVHMYVGVGAERVRALFGAAREKGKAVVFIDEIDAMGKKRGAAPGGGSDERDQTLNALLTEMSGFASSEGIVVIAATNRIDTLDEALLRPGRFDRQIEIGLPDMDGRRRILSLYAKNKPLSSEVDLGAIARQTVFFSGAMLENLMNEAAISAAKNGLGNVRASDVDEAYYTVVAGSKKMNRDGEIERERRVTAYHEAGHALAGKLLTPENRIAKLTIIPSTKGAAGFCVSIPPDRMFQTKSDLKARAAVALAGRAAEELTFGADNVTTGASNDIEKATAIAADIVAKYGMSETFGLVSPDAARLASDTALLRETRALTSECYVAAKRLLNENIHILRALAEELLTKETLTGDEIDAICDQTGKDQSCVFTGEK
ncbi:MAG: ATP-dependent metallopeptidase FtsH/Yme1/Tma family protein [Clostridiales bacterium]|jgi:cell division protease FtsH|nr:ATP-dependent metallopeptidase FtsH/Yme1/Tma family protein [Clostridiales bacterium]